MRTARALAVDFILPSTVSALTVRGMPKGLKRYSGIYSLGGKLILLEEQSGSLSEIGEVIGGRDVHRPLRGCEC
jgi:hypothetical protein